MTAFWHYGAAIAIVVLAYFIRGIAGFGSGLIAVPLLALFLPLTFAEGVKLTATNTCAP